MSQKLDQDRCDENRYDENLKYLHFGASAGILWQIDAPVYIISATINTAGPIGGLILYDSVGVSSDIVCVVNTNIIGTSIFDLQVDQFSALLTTAGADITLIYRGPDLL